MHSDATILEQAVKINLLHIQQRKVSSLREDILQAWQKIAPAWPLQHMIAANPLRGLEDLPFEEALIEGYHYFQQINSTEGMADTNRETIKWCQAFFDQGQATIAMPNRHLGLYQAFRNLVPFDTKLLNSDAEHYSWLANLPYSPEEAIAECLCKLKIAHEKRQHFLSLLLTALPGWASYIKYLTEWAHAEKSNTPVTQTGYLAMRVVLATIFWRDAKNLLKASPQHDNSSIFKKIKQISQMEDAYRKPLLEALSTQAVAMTKMNNEKCERPVAQLIFCIDVRSEPLRRALEKQGNYETFGFAGFFGIPVRVENDLLDESKTYCPALLRSKHRIKEELNCSDKHARRALRRIEVISTIKRIYQALKYNFTTPLTLVEIIGFWSGLLMSLRTLSPIKTTAIKRKILEHSWLMSHSFPSLEEKDDGSGIGFEDKCTYAENALRMMGLTQNFAPLIIICGHGSSTQNNAYSTALDCGACGGNRGAHNAKIFAQILNTKEVRNYLVEIGINIPSDSRFVAAEHNTTTDEVLFYLNQTEDATSRKMLDQLKMDLQAARNISNKYRCEQLECFGAKNNNNVKSYVARLKRRSNDWAQPRPEWGLARNAAFIVGPRNLAKWINLEGRAFLHSYNWQEDADGALLTTILTAPMIVAQWINSQYLFSFLDNIAYGSGSKITHNITGKIGIMQGNASDLMHGLPMQSLYRSDITPYHEPLRLLTIIYAPRKLIDKIISVQPELQKLFGNGWLALACIEPDVGSVYCLQRDLTWQKTIEEK